MELLGNGAYGTVSKMSVLGRTFALKKCPFSDGSEEDWGQWVACFREEATVHLHHPYLIKTFWARWRPGNFQRCMEVGIKVKMARPERVAHDIGQALCFLHELGFIHRDVKPDNILRVGNVYKLTDFGLCRRGKCDGTMSDYTVTRCFRGPELLQGGNTMYDGRVDMYSLGVSVWELEHGKQLFWGSKENILHQYKVFEARGMYKKLITDYENRYTSRQFLEHYKVQPVQGTVTPSLKRTGQVEAFAEYMRQGNVDAAYDAIGGKLKDTLECLY